jgi:hypothetical protein
VAGLHRLRRRHLLQFGFTNVCPLGWILKKLGVPEQPVSCSR